MYKKGSYFFIVLVLLYLTNIYVLKENISVKVGESAVVTTFSPMTLESKKGFFAVNNGDNIEIIGKKAGTEDVQLELLGIPFKTVSVSVQEKEYLIPAGITLGIRIDTKGVLVLGTGNVTNMQGKTKNPSKDKVFSGDIIYKIDGIDVSSKEELMNYIVSCEKEDVTLSLSRKNEVMDISIPIIKSIVDGSNKIGIWVRDSTQGIGTMTYINPVTKEFGALGHGILDIDTKDLMLVKKGSAYLSSVVSVTKGTKGVPGELVGEITVKDKIGSITENKEQGIYGFVDNIDDLGIIYEPLEIASFEEIVEGEAEILCSIDKTGIKRYKVNIENLNKNHKNHKNFVVEITDESLLNETSGIVQGMSGSPIIQNNKIIGAVTHVFVQDPTKGYGIYIKSMVDVSS